MCPPKTRSSTPWKIQEAGLKCDGIILLPSSIDVRLMEEKKENAYAQMGEHVIEKK